jgi:hypothetical protein
LMTWVTFPTLLRLLLKIEIILSFSRCAKRS